MSRYEVIGQTRKVIDTLAADVAKVYGRRPKNVTGPVTIKDLPEDVTARAVKEVQAVAPVEVRKSFASRLGKKQYALVGGGVVTGATLFNLDDLGFIDMIAQMTPDSQNDIVLDTAGEGEQGGNVANAIQRASDVMYSSVLDEFDYSQDQQHRVAESDRSIGLSGVQVEELQSYVAQYETCLRIAGSAKLLEDLIFIIKQTSIEDRVALNSMVKFGRR